VYEDARHRLTAAADFGKVLVRESGPSREADPAWKALFTAWTDDSLGDELDEATYHAGLEYGLMETIFLRTGWIRDRGVGISDYTLGAALQFRFRATRVQADYATTPQGAHLERVQRFSVTAAVSF